MNKYMFGYGSLINMDENFELIGHSTRQVHPVKIKKLSREWNIHGLLPSGQTFLGVNYDEKSWCNGILFCVSDEEIKTLDSREKYYTKKDIEKSNIIFYDDKQSSILDKIDKIIYYHTDPIYEGRPCIMYPVSMEYIKICIDGCKKISDEYKKDFIMTTKGWNDAIKHSKLFYTCV